MATSVSFSWPANVLSAQSYAARVAQSNLLLTVAQAWSFFTRSPQSSSYVAYEKSSHGSWRPLGTLPQSQGDNAYGLSRNQRSQSTELAILASEADFQACDDYVTRCLADAAKTPMQTIKNTTNTQNYCGNLQMVIQHPVKWSYRNAVPEEARGQAYLNARIECDPRR